MSYVIAIFVGVGEWGFIEFPGGEGSEKESHQILDLQRLASLKLAHFFFQVLIHVDPRPSSMTTDYRNSFNV